MPDVTTPSQEEKELPPEEVVEEQPTEQPEAPEQQPEQPEAPPEPEEAPPAPDPSADDLRKQLAAKEAEIAALKAQAPKEDVKKPDGTIRDMAIQTFKTQALPEAKKAFLDANATDEQRFQTIVNTTDQMLGAVMTDRINPKINNIAAANIELFNELEIRDMRAEDANFKKAIEPKVRAELTKMKWEDRAVDGVVKNIYYRVIGEQTNGKTPMPAQPAKPKPSPSIMRDVASGTPNATGTRSAGVRLSPAQEADRQEVIAESGITISPENYLARLKTRQDKLKTLNRPVPQTLRGV